MDLLLSLLKQLTQGKTILPECVDRLYENHTKRRTRPSLDEILQALQVVAISYSKVFIIVDALDECQTSNGCRHNFLSELFTLQQKWNVNIFGTSRFLPAIEALFQGSPSLEIRARREDILAYTDGHMSQLPSFVRGNHQLQQEIAVQIIQAVDGM